MSDGSIIEGRLLGSRTRTLCRLTGVEGRLLARRYGARTVAEALRLDEERDTEVDRREFVRALWRNRVEK